MGAIGKQRGDGRSSIAIMPGKGGAYGIVLATFYLGFVLGKRSHVGILLWWHSKQGCFSRSGKGLYRCSYYVLIRLRVKLRDRIGGEKKPRTVAGQNKRHAWLSVTRGSARK